MEILLIEGESRTATFLARGLAAQGFRVARAESGRLGLEHALKHRFDVVLLDLVLHEMNSLDVLKLLHAERPHLPVILLSGHTDLDTKIRGFELGAADFLQKPFALDELIARVYVHSRERNGRSLQSAFTVGTISVDPIRHEARLGDTVVRLTSHEIRLLSLLFAHEGEVVSRERLLSEIWGYYFDPRSNVVDVCVGRLRKKLGPEAPIETVRCAGYRLAPV
jgi:two-component system copper resistance phosphate regulon response regulator CusR